MARIEINFEKPSGAKPGKVIGFRAIVPYQGQSELLRHFSEFEQSWRDIHAPANEPYEEAGCP